MTKLKFNYEALYRTVINSLVATQDNISAAINTANSLDVPSGFRYASNLNEISSFLTDRRNELINMKTCIENSNKDYDNLEQLLKEELSKTKKVELKDRDNIIIKG